MGDERQGQLTAGETLRRFVGAFVDELARSGVAHVCLTPGSRSTPLTLLLREHPAIRVWTHLDERSAGFFALGMAKVLREPVAVLSTSGTAAVNFAPAVVEAYYDRVPLLVFTADRPPELHGIGSPQTIDQARLYGTHAKWFVDMILPDGSPEALHHAHTIAARAVATARVEAGPVHINFPFREPLIPAAGGPPPGRDGASAPGDAEASASAGEHTERADRRLDPATVASLAEELLAAGKGLIVCGPQDDADFPAAVARLAAELGFPLLADPLSQVRCGSHHSDLVIDSYDAFLRDEEIARELAPDVVLRFGRTPVSKPLLLYLQRHAGCRQLLADESGRWGDPGLTGHHALEVDPGALCEALLPALQASDRRIGRAASDWANRWQSIARQAGAALRRRLAAEPGLSEPGVFAQLAELLPAGATLFAGNSMPVRDLDSCFPGATRPVRFFANRGVSGIDGVVSSALGASAVGSGPLVLVIGDLSFYHDMNGLLAVQRHNVNATIVLLNNNGGGIFSFLPQADETEHFEELFGTPHGLDFRPAAELYGLAYRRAESWQDFREAIEASLDSPGVGLVEVRTDRRENVRLHRELWAAVSEAVRMPAEEAATP